MSARVISVAVAAAMWLVTAGENGAGLGAQIRGTNGARGMAAPSAAARDEALSQQPQDDVEGFAITAERAAAFARAQAEGLDWIPGELLVKFKPGVSLAQGARALSALRGPVNPRQGRWIGDVLLVATPGEDNADLASGILSQQPEVLWAHPNYIRRLSAAPTDPGYPSQWNLDQINLPAAWDINPGGKGDVLVAVVDSGVTEVTRTSVFQLWTGSRFELVPIPYAINPDIAEARFAKGRDYVLYAAGTPVLDMEGRVVAVLVSAKQARSGLPVIFATPIEYREHLIPVLSEDKK